MSSLPTTTQPPNLENQVPTVTPSTGQWAAPSLVTPTAPTTTTTTDPANLQAAASASPKADPSTVVGAATNATSTIDAAVKAQGITAFKSATQIADYLNGKSHEYQVYVWQHSPESVKSLLTAGGYTPPDAAAKPQSGGWWHDIVHGLDIARHAGATVGHFAFDNPAGHLANEAFVQTPAKLFNDAGRPITQLTDAFLMNHQQGDVEDAMTGKSGWSLSSIVHQLDLPSILRDYHTISSGAAHFQPEALTYVQNELGINGSALQLLKTYVLAGANSGSALKVTLASVPQSERAAAAQLILGNSKFQEAANLLNDSHLTLGQMVFGGLNPTQMKQLYPRFDVGSGELGAAFNQAATVAGAAGAVATGNPEEDVGILPALRAADTSSLVGRAEGTMGYFRARATAGIIGLGGAGIASSYVAHVTPDAATHFAPFGTRINPLSGIADGAFSWYSNPLFMGQKALTEYKAGVHGIAALDGWSDTRALRYYATVGSGRRYTTTFAKAVTTAFEDGAAPGELAKSANFAALDRAGIRIAADMQDVVNQAYPAIRNAVEAGGDGAAEVADMMASSQAMLNIARGNAGMYFRDASQYPHLSPSNVVLNEIRGGARKVLGGLRINPGKLSPRQIAADIFGRDVTNQGIEAANNSEDGLGRPARFARRAVTLTPLPFLKLSDAASDVQLERALGFALPQQKIDQIMNYYKAIPVDQIARRRLVALGGIRDMLVAAGVSHTGVGDEWLKNWLNRENYAMGDLAHFKDPMNPDGPSVPSAIRTNQLSDTIAMPDFRKVYTFAKKSWIMDKLQMGLNADAFDKFMSVFWKRAMLLRPGFAIRVALEEVLSFMMRAGVNSYVTSRVTSSLYDTANTMEELRAAGELISKKEIDAGLGDKAAADQIDVGELHESLTGHLPAETRAAVKTPQELLAAIQGHNAIDWARRIGVRMAPEWLLEGAYNLAKRGVLDSGYQEYIDSITSHGDVYLGDLPNGHEESGKIFENGQHLTYARTGVLKDISPGESTKEYQEYLPHWRMELAGLSGDSFTRAAARGYSNGGREGAVEGALSAINGEGIKRVLARAEADYQKALQDFREEYKRTGDEPSESRINYTEKVRNAKALELRRHEQLLKKFPGHTQNRAGQVVATGEISQDQAHLDWANAIVDDMLAKTTTDQPQDFTEVDGKKVPVPVTGRQPIRVPSVKMPRIPWKIGDRDAGRLIRPSNEEEAYLNVPKDHVRLFRAESFKTVDEGPTTTAAPNRTWYTSYEEASTHAGEDGTIWQVDVPTNTLKSEYDFNASAKAPELKTRDYAGEVGVDRHITRTEDGELPTSIVAKLRGAMEEERGAHARYTGDRWDAFKDDIAKNGIREPIFITVNHNDEPLISEGNNRLDAAVELGLPNVPVEIRYFGHAEQQGTVWERGTVQRDQHIDEIGEAQKAGKKGSGIAPPNRGNFTSGVVIHSTEGEAPPNYMIDMIGNHLTPSIDQLKQVDRVHAPAHLLVPETIPAISGPVGFIDRVAEKGMQQVVGRPLNWMSRQPIFTWNYARALREAKALIRERRLGLLSDEKIAELGEGSIPEAMDDLAHDIAMQRAINETLPYIHNPQVKSYLSVVGRNIAPFWFAQEQFYKRWARLFGTYPEAFYKLSQTVTGLKDVGFLYTDQYGKDAFVYPGSQAVLSLLSRLPFLGGLPVDVGFQAELGGLNPTTSSGSVLPIPSLGPLMTLPLTMVGGMWHRFTGVAQKALGPSAPLIDQTGGTWPEQAIEQLLPSFATRGIQWLTNLPANSDTIGAAIMMSAQINAAQQLESAGHGLPKDAQQPGHELEYQQYLDKIVNWSKNVLLLRTIFGLMAPATPEFSFAANGPGQVYQTLLSELPNYEQAQAEFIKLYPNAQADEIFESTTAPAGAGAGLKGSGTYVPATAAGAKFINDNARFFRNYSQLAPWSMPAATANGLFNSNAYNSEKALGLRFPRSLDDWYQEYKYSQGANVYYPLETIIHAAESSTAVTSREAQSQLGLTQAQALQKLGMPNATENQVKQVWTDWSRGFLAANPIFASNLKVRGDIAGARRANIVTQLNDALDKGALPNTPWSKQIAVMMIAFNKVQDAYAPAGGGVGTKGTAQATQNKLAFLQWGTAYAAAYPAVAAFWNGVLSKQVPG